MRWSLLFNVTEPGRNRAFHTFSLCWLLRAGTWIYRVTQAFWGPTGFGEQAHLWNQVLSPMSIDKNHVWLTLSSWKSLKSAFETKKTESSSELVVFFRKGKAEHHKTWPSSGPMEAKTKTFKALHNMQKQKSMASGFRRFLKKNIHYFFKLQIKQARGGPRGNGSRAPRPLTPAQHWTRSPMVIHSCCPCLPADISPSLLRDLTWWWWKLKQSVQESLRILPWGLLHWVPLFDWSPGAIWIANETKV